MPTEKTTNPDRFGRYRVRDRTAKEMGTWSTARYNPATMLLVPNAKASDGYGRALPPKPWRPLPAQQAPETPASAEETTNTDEESIK